MPAKASTGRAMAPALSRCGTSRACHTGRPRVRARAIMSLRAVALADDQQRVGALKLRVERRAQRPGREHAAIADAAAAVDHGHGEILGERAVLQAVVHDDDAGALRLRQRGAGDAVARDDGRRRAREQQRLVADLGRAVRVRLDPFRSGDAAAIAAGEEEHVLAGRGQHLRDGDGGRRLAGAAEGEIADADDRHAGARAVGASCAARRSSRSPRPAATAGPLRAPLCATRSRVHAWALSWAVSCRRCNFDR